MKSAPMPNVQVDSSISHIELLGLRVCGVHRLYDRLLLQTSVQVSLAVPSNSALGLNWE